MAYRKKLNIDLSSQGDDADSNIIRQFRPTRHMEMYAYHRAKRGDKLSVAALCREIGMDNKTVSMWKNKYPEFEEWLSGQIAFLRQPMKDLLEQVAVKNIDQYQFWNAQALKYGYIEKDPDETIKIKIEIDDEGL